MPSNRDFQGMAKGGERWHRRRYQDTPPPPPLGELIAEIDRGVLEVSLEQENHSPRIANSQYLTSYNWLENCDRNWREENCHTMIIPGRLSATVTDISLVIVNYGILGEPPAWTPPVDTPKLRQDPGQYYRDQNAWRSPEYPLQPAIQAILTDRPDFPRKNINIVGCGHSLSHLLEFVCEIKKPFRILGETVGETVFLIRRENSPTEVIQGIHGYGHTFPGVYTSWGPGIKRSRSHQRVLHYQFAGLDFIVRFGSDGYLPNLFPDDGITEIQESTEDTSSAGKNSVEIAASSMNEIEISSTPATETEPKRAVRLEKGGRRVPQSAVFDLKTRSCRLKEANTLENMLPRLWVSQIPNFILAYHEFGIFDDIQILDVRETIREWEELNQPSLSKFGLLLKKIILFAQSSELGRFEICYPKGGGALELRAQEGDVYRAMSPDVAQKWSGEEEDLPSR